MLEGSLDIAELNELFHIYSDLDVATAERNASAYANDVYNLTDTSGKKFVMRVLKIQDPMTVNLEAEMQRRLNAVGIRAPQYLEFRDHSFVGNGNGHNFTLSKHIEGEAPTTANPELVFDFGATLARIHDCLQGIVVPPNKMQWFDPKIAQQDLDAFSGPNKSSIATLFKTGSRLLDLELPEAVIHGDLWLSNVFAQGDKVTVVFDFETAQNTARIIDLARTYTSMKRESDLSQDLIINLLIDGYNSAASKPLIEAEEDNFKLAIVYVSSVVAAWHGANATGREEPYIEMGEQVLL